MRNRFYSIWLASSVVAVAVVGPDCPAEGLRNAPPGAYGLGRGGAKVAHVDDASAITINPANLLDLKQPELQIAPAFVYIDRDVRTPDGRRASTTEEFKVLGDLYYTRPAGEGPLAWGIGLTVPFGQSVVYESDFDFRFLTPYFSELKLIDVKPTVAYRVNDRIAIGGGLDLIYSELTFKQHYPWATLTGRATDPDGRMEFESDGFALGFNLAANWDIADGHRLSLTYKPSFKVDYEGDFTISNVPAEAAALGATGRSDLETEIEYPTIIVLGYGIEVTDTFRVEADIEWLEWSNFDELPLDVENNAILFPSTVIPEDWEDTITVGIGADWQWRPEWTLRGGYWFAETPIPERTQQPNIPESNLHLFSIGVERTWNTHSVGLSWLGIAYEDREIDNNLVDAFNGTYETSAHFVTLSYSRRF
ncbi:MAG: outer membrane protein transport protein [Verrucomicrobiota bacterium]